MSTRTVASTFVGLGAVTACALAAGLIHLDSEARVDQDSALAASHWGVEASADHGTTWTEPMSGSEGSELTVSLSADELRSSSQYRPFSLRTATGSSDGAAVSFSEAHLVEGDPHTASAVNVRAVRSLDGTCAGPAFDSPRNHSIYAGQRAEAHRFDGAISQTPVQLDPATETTNGAPETVCFEFSLAEPADGTVTFAWPLEISPDGGDPNA